MVSDASLEKIREILDYLKGDKPDDELAVFILIRSSLKRVPQIKKTFNIVIVFLLDFWLTISPQTMIDFQADASNELQNCTTFVQI